DALVGVVGEGWVARPTQGLVVIRRARAGLSKSGHGGIMPVVTALLWVIISGWETKIRSSPHRQVTVSRCARLPVPFGIPVVRWSDWIEYFHVLGIGAVLRE
ncbi:hypothetical protein TcG_11284, partial [Trypanosoma cruzi]